MLRAFLVAWTLIAGLAAGGLMYIVGWRPQATVVAERLASPPTVARDNGRSASSTPPPVAAAAAAPSGVSPDSPATTGSIGSAPTRAATKAVRRVDDRLEPSSPRAVEPVKTVEARPVVREEPKAAAANLGPATTVPLPKAVDTPEAAPPAAVATLQTPPAVTRNTDVPVGISKAPQTTEPAPATAGSVTGQRDEARPDTSITPALPLLSDRQPRQSRQRGEIVARPEMAASSAEPSVAEDRAEASERVTRNRTLKRARAAKARIETAQSSPRRVQPQPTRAAALDVERRARPTEDTRRSLRRQARLAGRTQMAAGSGSLDRLMDDFSRSGADFMHERTLRVGTRYLVERTTRHGTQYFYQQSGR